VAGHYGGRGGRFIGRVGAWYPGGARGVGCLTGGGPEETVHGELHTEDEAAVRLVARSRRLMASLVDGMMAELRCSRMTTIKEAGTVGNGRINGRGERRGEQSGERAWRLTRERRRMGPRRGSYAG
jgi:hypothetical protein